MADKLGKIVSADDDPVIRELVKAILEAEGYDVISVMDGAEVVEILDAGEDPGQLGCFILDIEMPRMTGLEVLTILKSRKETQQIPVIMLTAQPQSASFVKECESTPEHYILKPFTRTQLLEVLKQVFNSGKSSHR